MKRFFFIVFIILLAGAGAYYYLQLDQSSIKKTKTEKTEPLPIPEETEPEIEHPITEPAIIFDSDAGNPAEEVPAETEIEEPLPLLEDSDDKIKEILSEIIGNDSVDQLLKQTGIIHRFVVTVDSLPKKKLPMKYRLLPPTPGKFLVHKDPNERITLDPENFTRYDIYIQLLEKLDTKQFVKWYTRFYPLIQEAYDSLGYKDRYFNDRFIFVIDHLLKTPETIGTIQLTQPSVFYKFADPALQKLSSGQKILLRIGPANMANVKTKLVKIREELAAPQRDE